MNRLPLNPPSEQGASRRARLLLSPGRWLAGVRKHALTFLLEVVIFYAALQAFQALGYGGKVPHVNVISLGILMVVVAVAAGETTFRLYRRVWAVAGIQDAIAIGLAVAEGSFIVAIANYLIPGDSRPYRLLVPVLAAPTVAISIAAYRLLPRLLSAAPQASNRLLLVVSDSSAYATVKPLVQQSNPDWAPVAIVTANSADLSRTVMGIPVVGRAEDLKHWLESTQADGVAFLVSGDRPTDLRALFAVCLAAELPIFIVPRPDDWLHSQSGARFRRLTADDLVGRAPREIEVALAREQVAGKSILITGAAGSIGSELCRLLARLNPSRLVLVDNNESGLFEIAEELRLTSTVDVREALVSIVDSDLLMAIFADERPDIVFHAAAYKHVPMLETRPEQALLTNVIGTRNTLKSAAAAGVQKFVLISTDKAVTRHSVMGCTKRICELLVLTHSGPMSCWAVRFGNVVGSRGSVVPTFERQIEIGGPVTITHPEAARYMMTIREAVALVITTLRLARPGHLYMLDMGEPMKILSLAQALIRSRGLRPGEDIKIVFTGLRSGELLTEDLLSPEEGWRPTSHSAIREVVSPHNLQPDDLEWIIEHLHNLARQNRSDELARALKRSVPGPAAQPVPDEPSMAKPGSSSTPLTGRRDDG